MATGARAKHFQQAFGALKVVPLRYRQWLWTILLAIALIGFVASHECLHSYLRSSAPFINGPPSNSISNLSLLAYSAINPEGWAVRRKIQQLLTLSEYGKIGIREIVYERSSVRQTTYLSRDRYGPLKRVARSRENAWMLPLSSKRFVPFLPNFYEMAKKWVGNGEPKRSAMRNLVESVKRPLDQHWVANNSSIIDERQRYGSCAVVGNSGILLNSSYGARIDSHEVVIRLNNAGILQHSEHVGSKTSVSFMNSNVFRFCSRKPDCWCHPYGEEVPIVLYICQAQHLMDVAYCSPRYASPVIVTESLMDALCARIVKWYSLKHFVEAKGKGIEAWDSVHHDVYFHYSSGMQAIMLALGICDSVEIFGFGKSERAKHHYHTEQKKELDLHDYEAEYLFYDDLVHNRTIPFLSEAGFSIPPVRIFY